MVIDRQTDYFMNPFWRFWKGNLQNCTSFDSQLLKEPPEQAARLKVRCLNSPSTDQIPWILFEGKVPDDEKMIGRHSKAPPSLTRPPNWGETKKRKRRGSCRLHASPRAALTWSLHLFHQSHTPGGTSAYGRRDYFSGFLSSVFS